MIDVETFGTRPGCVVRSIGAVQFDLKTGEIGDQLYFNLETDSQIETGGHIEPQTVNWWATQSKEAQDALLVDQQDTYSVLMGLQTFIKQLRLRHPWSHGSNFDLVLLENLFYRYRIKCPWLYYNARDTRTILDLAGMKLSDFKRNGTHHNALDDALHQVRTIHEAYKQLKG